MPHARTSVETRALRALIDAAYDVLRRQSITELERLLHAVERVERDLARAQRDVS